MKKNFIGIDVSKLKLDVYLHNKLEHKIFANHEEGYQKMITWLKSLKVSVKSMAVCFEHTGIYSEDLATFLTQKKVCFYMESSLNIKYSIGLSRGKSDKIDSKRIAAYIAMYHEQLTPSIITDNNVSKLRKLLSLRSFLEKEIVALKNRIKNSIKESGIEFVLKLERDMLESKNKYLKELESEIKKLIKSDVDMNKMDQLIQSIKGVGPMTSWNFIATTNKFNYFENARQFACYIGVAPFEKSSGSSIKGKNQTDRRSNRKLNAIITMAARSAALYNPEIKEYMDRKLKEGKHYNCVLNAIKNKLIARIFAVVQRQSPYVDLKKYAA
jgi:transposase